MWTSLYKTNMQLPGSELYHHLICTTWTNMNKDREVYGLFRRWPSFRPPPKVTIHFIARDATEFLVSGSLVVAASDLELFLYRSRLALNASGSPLATRRMSTTW